MRTPSLALDSRQQGLLFNTALLGIGTAVLATAIGAPLGIVLARVPLRRRGTGASSCGCARSAAALCRRARLGQSRAGIGYREWTYSLAAAIVVLSLVLYPLSMLATEVAMRRIDGRLEEAD